LPYPVELSIVSDHHRARRGSANRFSGRAEQRCCIGPSAREHDDHVDTTLSRRFDYRAFRISVYQQRLPFESRKSRETQMLKNRRLDALHELSALADSPDRITVRAMH